MAYGFNAADQFRRSAAYVARILQGEKAGDLPVQAPSLFELGVNLRTARALGLHHSSSPSLSPPTRLSNNGSSIWRKLTDSKIPGLPTTATFWLRSGSRSDLRHFGHWRE